MAKAVNEHTIHFVPPIRAPRALPQDCQHDPHKMTLFYSKSLGTLDRLSSSNCHPNPFSSLGPTIPRSSRVPRGATRLCAHRQCLPGPPPATSSTNRRCSRNNRPAVPASSRPRRLHSSCPLPCFAPATRACPCHSLRCTGLASPVFSRQRAHWLEPCMVPLSLTFTLHHFALTKDPLQYLFQPTERHLKRMFAFIKCELLLCLLPFMA